MTRRRDSRRDEQEGNAGIEALSIARNTESSELQSMHRKKEVDDETQTGFARNGRSTAWLRSRAGRSTVIEIKGWSVQQVRYIYKSCAASNGR